MPDSSDKNSDVDVQTELALAKAEIARLKEEYQEFVYIVSHDLSAPLRQIEGFSEMVLEKHQSDFDVKTQRHFDFIVKGSHTIKGILDDLTRYSRINTQNDLPKSLDINQVIAQSLNELSTLIDEKNAEFTYQEMPIIEGEESLLSTIFYQLIHNALHYQAPGNQPKIHIGVEELEKEWRFCITDNGIGITTNLSDKIFKMFRRGVSHKHYEGAGTGLTFAKRIINKYHGDIWFESIKGQGSSFYFTLSKC